ncbi:MAG: AAA family ATPase [Deltaproteobacteria bacterium]|nr:AAA family ATPase [Deltaproteobacteria bacterium]
MDGVIIVSGVPGAGKSTLAPLLAARFERGVHIEADALQRMIVSGGRWPGEEPIEEGYGQLRLRGLNTCLLGDSFRQAGFVPVLDDIVVGSRVDEFLADLQSRPVYLVMLLPDLETLERRNAERAKENVFHQALGLDPVARNETPMGLRIDTSDQSPVQSVEAVMDRLEADARIA